MEKAMTTQAIAHERAQRLRFLRGMIGLSRDQIHYRYGIPKGSLQNWEAGTTPLSRKGAGFILRACAAEGVVVLIEWLMHGIGVGPQRHLAKQQQTMQLPNALQPMRRQIVMEIQALRALYPDSIDMPVEDNAMHPQYPQGSYVAGIRHYGAAIATCIGQDCIVFSLAQGMQCRRLMLGSQANRYHLLPLNLQVEHPIAMNIDCIYAAPVMWLRAPALTM